MEYARIYQLFHGKFLNLKENSLVICLQQETGEDIFTTKIQPKFKQYVIDALKSVKEMVQNRKNTFEIFGFDFMIDENYNPWIIEINSSPAMDYSTDFIIKKNFCSILNIISQSQSIWFRFF